MIIYDTRVPVKIVKKVKTAKHSFSLADICETSSDHSRQPSFKSRRPDDRQIKSQATNVQANDHAERVVIKHADIGSGKVNRLESSSQPVHSRNDGNVLAQKYLSQNSIEEMPEDEDSRNDKTFKDQVMKSITLTESIIIQDSNKKSSQRDISIVEKSRTSQEDSRHGILVSNDSSDNAAHIDKSKTPDATPLKQSLVSKPTNMLSKQPSLSKSKKVAFSMDLDKNEKTEVKDTYFEQRKEATSSYFQLSNILVEQKTEEIAEKKPEVILRPQFQSFSMGIDTKLSPKKDIVDAAPKHFLPTISNQEFMKSIEQDSKLKTPEVSPKLSKNASIFGVKLNSDVSNFFGNRLIPIGQAAIKKDEPKPTIEPQIASIPKQEGFNIPTQSSKTVQAPVVQVPNSFFGKPIVGPMTADIRVPDTVAPPVTGAIAANQGVGSSTFFKPASQISASVTPAPASNGFFNQNRSQAEPISAQSNGASLFSGLRSENTEQARQSSAFKFGDEPKISNINGATFWGNSSNTGNAGGQFHNNTSRLASSSGVGGFFNRNDGGREQSSSGFFANNASQRPSESGGNSFFGQSKQSQGEGAGYNSRNQIEDERNERASGGGGGNRGGFFGRGDRGGNQGEESRGADYGRDSNRGVGGPSSFFGGSGGNRDSFAPQNDSRQSTNPFLPNKSNQQSSIFGNGGRGSNAPTGGNNRRNNGSSVLGRNLYGG